MDLCAPGQAFHRTLTNHRGPRASWETDQQTEQGKQAWELLSTPTCADLLLGSGLCAWVVAWSLHT